MSFATLGRLACVSLLAGYCAASIAQPAADQGALAVHLASAAQAVEMAMAPIKTRAAFDAYMARDTSSDNPMLWLSPDARRRFIAHMYFDSRIGMVSVPYDDVEAELTLSQAYRLAALFGQQWFVAAGLPDIRVVTDEDRVVDAWRQAYRRAQESTP